jgi:hypothetical protein
MACWIFGWFFRAGYHQETRVAFLFEIPKKSRTIFIRQRLDQRAQTFAEAKKRGIVRLGLRSANPAYLLAGPAKDVLSHLQRARAKRQERLVTVLAHEDLAYR